MVPSQVASCIHSSKSWACEWLKNYGDESIEGLKDRSKTGRHSQASKPAEHRIKKYSRQPKFDHKTSGRGDCKKKLNRV